MEENVPTLDGAEIMLTRNVQGVMDAVRNTIKMLTEENEELKKQLEDK